MARKIGFKIWFTTNLMESYIWLLKNLEEAVLLQKKDYVFRTII